jgi:hypothetical protein
LPECSPCPRNLQYVLNGVIEEFLNVTTEVEKLQNFTQVVDYFDKTALRLEIAKVRNEFYWENSLELIELSIIKKGSFV